MKNKPELLAPAGGREALIAAVQNGADAVYLGAGDFNARQTADNFAGDALKEAVDYCHARGVCVYVTLNTMVRDDELTNLGHAVEAIAAAGADAVLVQDFGVAKAARQIAPDLPLHASTQMAVHNRSGVEFLAKQGFTRVVLAREMDLESIRECAGLGAELEVFVHGALCVACSGQCLMSSLVGGRSGNRGRCAQPCRLPYRMDGIEGHLLSTRDLCSLNHLEALREVGVASLKIEGRLKRPEYVATVVSAYREALDRPKQEYDLRQLQQIFNRGGFTKGYVPGVEDMDVMFAPRPNHLGVEVGRCIAPGKIELEADLDPSDALVLRRPDALKSSKSQDRPVRLTGSRGQKVGCSEAQKGDLLIRLVSEAQMRATRESYQDEHRQTPLTAGLTLRVGKPAMLTVSDGKNTVTVTGDIVEPAKSKGADVERIRAQIQKTGGTAYRIDSVEADVDGNAFCPVSALNALRRAALDELTARRMPAPHRTQPLELPQKGSCIYPEIPAVKVQSGNPELLKKAIGLGADGAIFAPLDVRENALSAAAEALPKRFSLAVPAVLPERALHTLNAWALSMAGRIDSVYLSNIGHLNHSWPGALSADYSLNLANRPALEQMDEWGFSSFTPSVELNAGQIQPLSGNRELIVYGRLPLMHLRHCPYRAVHGLKGKHADCRRCDKCAPADHIDARTLTDRTGTDFPLRRLVTEEGCIVQLLNSVPLMLLKRIQRLPKADAWRLLIDNPNELENTLRLYKLAAAGADFRSHAAWAAFESMNTTTGHYFRGAE